MTTIGPRQGVLCLAGIAAMFSAACGSGTGGESSGSTSSAASTPSQPAAQVPPSPSAQGVPIRITFGSTTLTGRLNDTSTARALADQLPLTLPFRDVMNQEKIAALPRALPLTGVPEGDNADPGDIGYWVPDKSLVLYYRDVGFYNGIVRIGSFDGDREIAGECPRRDAGQGCSPANFDITPPDCCRAMFVREVPAPGLWNPG